MKIFIRSISLVLILFSVASAQAKTFKYDLIQMGSNPGPVRYEGLEFYNPSSAILTIVNTPPSTEIKLAVEISFPKAAKLFATNFKSIDGSKYRAVVNDVWIYKEVIVEVENMPVRIGHPVEIKVFVSERSAFNNPVADNEPNYRSALFHVSGQIRDITPTRTVDTLTTTVFNKKLILSLKDRLVFNPEERRESFAIEATWYGKGTKTLYLPAPVQPSEFDDVEAIALNIRGGTPENPLVEVTYKTSDNREMPSEIRSLQELLSKAYGSSASNQPPIP